MWPSPELVSASAAFPLTTALVLLSGIAIVAGSVLGTMAFRSNNRLADAINSLKAAADAARKDAGDDAEAIEELVEDVQDDVEQVKAGTTELMKAQTAMAGAVAQLAAQSERLAADHEAAAARRQAEMLREVQAGRDLAEANATALQALQNQVNAASAGLETTLKTAMQEALQALAEQIKQAAASEVDRIGKEALQLLRNGQQIILNAVEENRRHEHEHKGNDVGAGAGRAAVGAAADGADGAGADAAGARSDGTGDGAG